MRRYLNFNQLTGFIPVELAKVSTLLELKLDDNRLTGEIPADFSKLTSLQILDLSSNFFTGVIPPQLMTIPELELHLQDNCFTGTRPRNNVSSVLDVDTNCFNDDLSCKCESGNHGISKTIKSVIIAVGVIAGTLLLAAVSLFVFCRRVRKPKTIQSNGKQYVVKQYALDEVKDATNNFTTILGSGAFAIVYHAKFQDGKEAAVKHFKKRGVKGPLEEFEKEVDFLAKIHHRFLVNLVGYCTDQGHHMLLFEFMNIGNLKESLRSGQDSPVLTWEERVRIMISVGHGLEYLHFGRSPPLIHRDIKSANILLSSTTLNPSSILGDHNSDFPRGRKLIAKIADFGLGRETVFDDDEAIRAYGHEIPKPLQTKVAGTPGYIDPECFITSVLSSAVDVYSFGVVLLELITGKPAFSPLLSNDDSWAPLVEWAMPQLEKKNLLDIVDPRLEKGSYDQEQLLAVAEQARLCTQRKARLRPSIRDVVRVFTEVFRVETKMVENLGSSHSLDTSKRHIVPSTGELMGETFNSMKYSYS